MSTRPLLATIAASARSGSGLGRAFTGLPARPARPQSSPTYLAGRVEGVSIEVLLKSPTELLIAFASTEPNIVAGRVWRSEKTPVARDRLARWWRDGTILRAYLSECGAVMLADRQWGGNVACTPALGVD